MDTKNVAQAAAAELARAIERVVDLRVRAALASVREGDLEGHDRQPEPRRVTCEACVAGEVEGAIKSGRRWVATRSAWAAWRAGRASQPTGHADVLDFARAAARRAAR